MWVDQQMQSSTDVLSSQTRGINHGMRKSRIRTDRQDTVDPSLEPLFCTTNGRYPLKAGS